MNNLEVLNNQELEMINGGFLPLPGPPVWHIKMTIWIAEKIADALK